MRAHLLIVILSEIFCTTYSWAAPRYPVSPIPTLICMSLQVTDQQAMDPRFVVPVFENPSKTSPVVGRASSVVLAKSPMVEKNGFIAAVLFNGVAGWIAANTVGPWHTMDGSRRQCIPSRMSDGSIGFNIK